MSDKERDETEEIVKPIDPGKPSEPGKPVSPLDEPIPGGGETPGPPLDPPAPPPDPPPTGDGGN